MYAYIRIHIIQKTPNKLPPTAFKKIDISRQNSAPN